MKRVKANWWLTLAVLLVVSLLVVACGTEEAEPTEAPAAEPTLAPTEPPAEEPAEEPVEEPAEEPVEEPEEVVEEPAEPAEFGRCGDPSQLSEQLNFHNWADYIDEAILEQFEAECGVKVVMDVYSANEENIAKLQAGNSGYDVTIPTDYAVEILIGEGLLEPLNMDWIPNAKNLDPESMGWYYDPDNTYSLPYQMGTTGLAYNSTYFPEAPDSWAVLFDTDQLCEYKGMAMMLDDQNEGVAAALGYLGYSWNEMSPEAHDEARELLIAQKECLAGYSSDVIQLLASEEIILSEAWSFAAAIARLDNENVHYTIPKEGGFLWQDNMVIPVDAPHKYTAHVFINYLLEADIGAQLTEWTFGFTPNLAAKELLSDDYYTLMTEGGMMIDDQARERMEYSLHVESQLRADTWTAVKSQ